MSDNKLAHYIFNLIAGLVKKYKYKSDSVWLVVVQYNIYLKMAGQVKRETRDCNPIIELNFPVNSDRKQILPVKPVIIWFSQNT